MKRKRQTLEERSELDITEISKVIQGAFVYHVPISKNVSEEENDVYAVPLSETTSEKKNAPWTSVLRFKSRFDDICKKLDMNLAKELYKGMSKKQLETTCSCSPKTGCHNMRCSCVKAGVLCSSQCKCKGCKNLFSNLQAF